MVFFNYRENLGRPKIHHLEKTMNRKNSFFRHLFILVLATLFSYSALAYEVGDWTVLQLTDNEIIDTNPRVEGRTVVWNGQGATNQWQVFMWKDGVTTMLTDNISGHVQPRIGGDLVVWTKNLSSISSYDGTIHELTPSFESHSSPEASAGNAAWLGEGTGVNRDVYFFDGTDYIQVTHTLIQESHVRISGTSVVWSAPDENGYGDIFYYNGTDVIPVTDNANLDKYPQITDGGPGDFHITYESYVDGNWEVFHYDGTTFTNLSNSPTMTENYHQSCGDRTVWRTYSDGQYRVWLHDGNTASVVSQNDMASHEPQVSESLVAWHGSPGWPAPNHIYVYDGTETTQLTEIGGIGGVDPQVSGDTVVWVANDGYDDEIFIAYKTDSGTSSVPDASSLTVSGASPNPFNPSTQIHFASSKVEEVSVQIFDLRGRLMVDLGEKIYSPGQHSVSWNGTDSSGKAVPSGVYFYQVQSQNDRQVGKLTLVE
jgi:FlgD Ig-like domain